VADTKEDIFGAYLNQTQAPSDAQGSDAAASSSNVLGDYLKTAPAPAEASGGGAGGYSPTSAIPESPLGIIDRARLGWAKTPKAQHDLLSDSFGADNVKLVPGSDGANFVVKDKDGLWKQVDPQFKWDLSLKGTGAGALAGAAVGGVPGAVLGAVGGAVAPSFANTTNLKDLPGDIAQFAGQYGLKSMAAAKGGIEGTAMGAAVGGPLGGVIGGIAGAGLAATGEDVVETGARALGSAAGVANPNSLPQDNGELQKQLAASFLFGASQEAGGKLAGGLYRGSVKALSKAVDALSDTPGGRYVASKIVSAVSGPDVPVSLARVRVDNPKAMEPYDTVALEDAKNNTNNLFKMMKGKVQSAYSAFQSAKRVLGEQYNKVEDVAGKLDFDPTNHPTSDGQSTNIVQGLLDKLEEEGYTRGGQLARANNSAAVEKDITEAEKGAIRQALFQAKNVIARADKGEKLSFQEMRNLSSNVEKRLLERDGVLDPNLRRILLEYAGDIKSSVMSTIHEADPASAKLFADLNAKWGPVKDLMGDFASKSDDDMVDAFVKKVVKADGTMNAELMSNLSELLGAKDPTQDILRMHLARKSTALWSGSKVLGVPLPSGPRAGAALVRGVAGVKGAVGQLGSGVADHTPYMGEAFTFLKGLRPEVRTQLLKSPEAFDAFSGIIGSMKNAEDDTKNALLKESGAVQ
jgi:hypothetical protein